VLPGTRGFTDLDDKEIARTPRPVEGLDMRRLPLGPEEAFVLSRVDGMSSEAEISAATGLIRAAWRNAGAPGRARRCWFEAMPLRGSPGRNPNDRVYRPAAS
jgi:hypothetical protein